MFDLYGHLHLHRVYTAYIQRQTLRHTLLAASPPPFEGIQEALVRGRATFAGPPDQLVEALLDLRREAGVPVEFVARGHFPLLDHEAQLDLMQQLADGVAPHV